MSEILNSLVESCQKSHENGQKVDFSHLFFQKSPKIQELQELRKKSKEFQELQELPKSPMSVN